MNEAQAIKIGRLALALWALLTGIYLLTTGGHTYASDEEKMFTMAESLWYHGNFAINQGPPLQYSQYNPGLPAASLPFYAVGRVIATFFPPEAENWLLRAVFSWINPCVTAAIATALLYSAIRLGFSARVGVALGLLYGLGTMAWPHSKTFFAEPLTALPLVIAFGLISGVKGDKRPWLSLWLAGLLSGSAVLVKIHGILVVPFLGLYALLVSWERYNNSDPANDLEEWSAWILKRLLPACYWGFGVSLSIGLLLLIQWRSFGHPLHTGYGGGTGEFIGHNSLSPGLFGLTFSSGKGIVWYSPVLLLLPFALWPFLRRHWQAFLTCTGIVVINLLFYAQIFVWHGDGAWGPRYLNIMLPFAVVPLAGFLAQLRGRQTPWCLGALIVALLICIPVQIAGLTIHFNTYIGLQRDANKRYFEPAHSPIIQQLGMVGKQIAMYSDLWFAPNRLVIGDGFSYSEGDRDQGEQLPRWTQGSALVDLRSSYQAKIVRIGIDACRPEPISVGTVTLQSEDGPLFSATPCPVRTFQVLLKASNKRIWIESDDWNPQDIGIDREGPLGVRITHLSAQVNQQELETTGRLIPVKSMPSGFVSLRNWFGDPRNQHWDFWWWYIAFSDLPRFQLFCLAVVWATFGGWLAYWGGTNVVRQLLGGVSTQDKRRVAPRMQRA